MISNWITSAADWVADFFRDKSWLQERQEKEEQAKKATRLEKYSLGRVGSPFEDDAFPRPIRRGQR